MIARLLVLLLAIGTAHADPRFVHRRIAPGTASHAPRVLFLDRCAGGCTVRGANIDDAAAQMSTLPNAGNFAVSEYAWGDARWADLVYCVREVYSPYGVTVTDARPVHDTYNTVLVAGSGIELGFGGVAGVALLSDDCSPYSNVMSFVFANAYAPENVRGLCWAVAHESGHAFGLDHSFQFADGSSACRDPMSYRTDCDGQRFFRNRTTLCGETFARPCECGQTQNAHATLLGALGPGTPITAPPAIGEIGVSLGHDTVFVQASAQRGVHLFELWLNGWRWDVVWPPYATEASYKLDIPDGVPGGLLDVFVVAKDDLGASATSQTVTVMKGPPCTTASTCLRGQRCDAGYCRWDAPVGEFGDACTYRQYCKSELCIDSVCTRSCDLEDPDCPSGFACAYIGPGGVCLPGKEWESSLCTATNPSGALFVLFLICMGLRRRTRAG